MGRKKRKEIGETFLRQLDVGNDERMNRKDGLELLRLVLENYHAINMERVEKYIYGWPQSSTGGGQSRSTLCKVRLKVTF